MADFDVLSLRVLNRILRDGDSTGVVVEDRSFCEFVSIIQHLILDPEDLGTAASGRDIFGFSGGDGYKTLFLVVPADKTMTQELTSSRCDFAINGTPCMISICISNEVKLRIARVPDTKRWCPFEITKNSFDSRKMRLFWIGLISSTHAGREHDIGSARSEVQ